MAASRDDYIVVWHGAAIHPLTGVKGGLTAYPNREEPLPNQLPVELPSRPPIPCAQCGVPMDKPAWLAKRRRFCGRLCSLAARAARRRKAALAFRANLP